MLSRHDFHQANSVYLRFYAKVHFKGFIVKFAEDLSRYLLREELVFVLGKLHHIQKSTYLGFEENTN